MCTTSHEIRSRVSTRKSSLTLIHFTSLALIIGDKSRNNEVIGNYMRGHNNDLDEIVDWSE